MLRRSVLRAALAAALLLSAAACAAAGEVKLGMSREDVVHLLGEPDRKAVLEGKLLRDLDRLPATEDISRFRLVYFYDETKLQVWFLADKVTGVTRNGISVL
jgi:hypothetical protein